MTHISIPIDSSIEFVDLVEVTPFISKCVIKVCYLGENRNKTYITKEVATEMGRKLPGSPIVGFYNKETEDFEQHNRELTYDGEKYVLVDTTKAYGFVDLNAKVWFQKFIDDGINEREYLVTEGYIWTNAYPESQRIIDKGNNQSMEIDKKSVSGSWAKDDNGKNKFFIFNEALIEKLCILGEDYEPCFEGATITKFSLEEQFIELKNTMFSMINELKEVLSKGGKSEMVTLEEEKVIAENLDEKEENLDEKEQEIILENEIITEEIQEKDLIEEEVFESEIAIEEEKPEIVIEETEEYLALKNSYDELNTRFATLVAENENLKAFKLNCEKTEKLNMINSFSMLAEEDKKEVMENIDNYSLDEIEAKLAVMCVRNKVNFNLNEEENSDLTFNLNEVKTKDTGLPLWIKAVKETANTLTR